MQKVLKVAKQLLIRGSVQLDMVRAKLLKFKFSFHPHEGEYLRITEIYHTIFRVGFKCSEFTHRMESYTKGIIKKMN